MNIVIFGPDNSGKTTLSHTLMSKYVDMGFNCEVVHSPGPVEVERLVDFMRTEVLDKDSKDVKIFDRFPLIEESIYGPIVRGINRLKDYSDEIFDKIDKFIYCYPGLFRVINWGTREQMDGVKDNILDIIDGYNRLAIELKEKGYNIVEYNYSEHIEDSVFILEALRRFKEDLNEMKVNYNPAIEYTDAVSYINKIDKLMNKIKSEVRI